MNLQELADKSPLIAAAVAIPELDVEAACQAVGLPEPATLDSLDGLWLGQLVQHAGLGLPADPYRVRSWLRFGTPAEEPAAGDVAVTAGDTIEWVGIWLSAGPQLTSILTREGVRKVDTTAVLTTRRPIIAED
mgnify:CR=1 FL=1